MLLTFIVGCDGHECETEKIYVDIGGEKIVVEIDSYSWQWEDKNIIYVENNTSYGTLFDIYYGNVREITYPYFENGEYKFDKEYKVFEAKYYYVLDSISKDTTCYEKKECVK